MHLSTNPNPNPLADARPSIDWQHRGGHRGGGRGGDDAWRAERLVEAAQESQERAQEGGGVDGL